MTRQERQEYADQCMAPRPFGHKAILQDDPVENNGVILPRGHVERMRIKPEWYQSPRGWEAA